MGNCIVGSNKIVAQGEKQEPPMEALVIKETASRMRNTGGKKKMARLKLGEDDTSDKRESGSGGGGGGETRSGVVKIRVVVTQRELRQLLSYTKSCNDFSCNKEQLLSALKLRGRRVSEVRASDGGIINYSWRPALESIPENHSQV